MNFSRTLLATAIAAAAFSAQAADTVKLQVNGMVCAFCAQGIEKRLTKMPETGEIYINLAQKVVAVQPKAGQTIDVNKVKAEVTEAGYEVVKMEAVPQTVAAIRAEMKSQKK
jgi:periplasmic mercuric ion binding protein